MKLLSFLIYLTNAYKFLVLNDMHYNPNYTEPCNWGFCQDLGVYGDDSPWDLIANMV